MAVSSVLDSTSVEPLYTARSIDSPIVRIAFAIIVVAPLLRAPMKIE